MVLYKESSKTKPILFFETFINDKVLLKYEDMYYYPINNSQENFKEQGYLTYYKSSYEDGEPFVREKLIIKDQLEKLLNAQVLLSIQFLTDRRDEIEYQNSNANIFIQRQLITIKKIRSEWDSNSLYKDLILKNLTILENNIKILGGNLKDVSVKIKRNNPFFEPKVKNSILKKLYDIAITHMILDDEEVLEESFIAIFNANNPEQLESKIIFCCNNQVATYYLNNIEVFFNNLSHSKISKSNSFYNKKKKLLNQNDLDKAKNLYKAKKETLLFNKIKKNISCLISEIK